MQIRKRKCINKLFIPILYLQVSTSGLSYFTEFIFGNCCIPTQIMEFCDKGFLYLLFFYCMLSSSEPYWKKMNIKFSLIKKKKVMEELTFFSAYFWNEENLNFCGVYFCEWKTGNFAEFIFAIQFFFGIRFCNFGKNFKK